MKFAFAAIVLLMVLGLAIFGWVRIVDMPTALSTNSSCTTN